VLIALEKPSLEELSHYGVLGMHWGKRKAESASIAKARAVVAKEKSQYKKALKDQRNTSAFGAAAHKAQSNANSAHRELGYSLQDLSSAKILDKLKGKDKSSAQLKMESEYKKKGMGSNEASVAAYQHLKTQKILLALGAVALGIGAYKFHNANVDKIVKAGTLLQHVTADSTKGVNDAFYSSKNILDKIKYKGLYGNQLNVAGEAKVAHVKSIKVLSDIKQASHKNAKASLSELFKSDAEFAKGVKSMVEGNAMFGGPAAKKSLANLNKGKLDTKAYELFNRNLVNHSPDMQKLTDAYYKKLSSKGYNALQDINDVKYSGYKSVNPIISFNTTGKVEVVSVRKLIDKELETAKKVGYATIFGSGIAKTGAQITATVLAVDSTKSAINNRKAATYRKKHPGTKMTNTAIIRMLERQDQK